MLTESVPCESRVDQYWWSITRVKGSNPMEHTKWSNVQLKIHLTLEKRLLQMQLQMTVCEVFNTRRFFAKILNIILTGVWGRRFQFVYAGKILINKILSSHILILVNSSKITNSQLQTTKKVDWTEVNPQIQGGSWGPCVPVLWRLKLRPESFFRSNTTKVSIWKKLRL